MVASSLQVRDRFRLLSVMVDAVFEEGGVNAVILNNLSLVQIWAMLVRVRVACNPSLMYIANSTGIMCWTSVVESHPAT